MKKKKERSELRKLLGLMIVLPAADMGSAFCFTCSTLIVTSLLPAAIETRSRDKTKLQLNPELRQEKLTLIHFLKVTLLMAEAFSGKNSRRDGERGGLWEIKAHLDRRGILWVVTSWVGLKVKMARYFLRSSLKTQRAHGMGCVCTYFFFFYFF